MVDRVTLDRDLTATVTCDCDHPPHLKSVIRRCRQRAEEPHDHGPIEPQSWRDRAAIVARSSSDHTSFATKLLLPDSTTIDGNLGPRSNLNRGPIVVLLRGNWG